MPDDSPTDDDRTGADAADRDDDGAAATDSGGTDGSRARVESALRAVRREARKAAAVHAAVDAAAVFLAANLLLVALDPGWLPGRVPLPAAVVESVGAALGWAAGAAVPGSALVAAAAGFAAFVAELWLRSRRPVERFEAVNPPVAEALRTARDAVERDADSPMARRLYADVCEDLRSCSSLGLVAWRRVGVTVALTLLVGLATVQVAVADVTLVGPGATDANETGGERIQNYTGLRDGDRVLGAPESVRAGNETLTARVESGGGGRELDESEQFPSGDAGGGSGDAGSVEGQEAGYSPPERVEDADLVREYNRRIREDGGDSSGGQRGGRGGSGGDAGDQEDAN